MTSLLTSLLVTRPGGESDPLVLALRGLGYRVHAVPTVATEALPLPSVDGSEYDWVVVTSAAGVAALGDLQLHRGTGRRPRWAAVGQATARALEAIGVIPDLVPAATNGAAIADELPEADGARVLLARADAASDDLPERLRQRGARVDDLAVYHTVEAPSSSAAPLRQALQDPALAAVIFASGSAIHGFLKLGGTAAWPAVTIGPRTTAEAIRAGFTVLAEAGAQSTDSLAGAVRRVLPPSGTPGSAAGEARGEPMEKQDG